MRDELKIEFEQELEPTDFKIECYTCKHLKHDECVADFVCRLKLFGSMICPNRCASCEYAGECGYEVDLSLLSSDLAGDWCV